MRTDSFLYARLYSKTCCHNYACVVITAHVCSRIINNAMLQLVIIQTYAEASLTNPVSMQHQRIVSKAYQQLRVQHSCDMHSAKPIAGNCPPCKIHNSGMHVSTLRLFGMEHRLQELHELGARSHPLSPQIDPVWSSISWPLSVSHYTTGRRVPILRTWWHY